MSNLRLNVWSAVEKTQELYTVQKNHGNVYFSPETTLYHWMQQNYGLYKKLINFEDFEVYCWNNAGSLSKMDIFWKLGQPINQENLTKMRIKGRLWDTRTFMLKRLKVHNIGFHFHKSNCVIDESGDELTIPSWKNLQ